MKSAIQRSGSGKPGRIFFRAFFDRTDIGDRSNFDDGAVLQTGTLLGDLDRFVLVRDGDIEIATDRFLRFSEWAVGNHALFSGNNFSFLFQRMTAGAFSFCLQPFKSSHPV